MSYREEAEKYWNAVAEKRVVDRGETAVFADNFAKIRIITRWLLKNDFSKQDILEIGPGNGIHYMLQSMTGNAKNYRGLDISSTFAGQVKDLFGGRVDVGDAADMPFDDNSFDVLFAFDVMEHVRLTDRDDVFIEINRVMKPLSRIFINNPLTAGLHDKRFDFDFELTDFHRLFSYTDFRIYSLKEYGLKNFKECPVEEADRRYQMVELRRGDV